jgi:hypothetical protein
MTTLTLNINDLEKLAKNGNDDLVILTKNEYNELIQKIRDLEYWNKIDKRIKNIKAGNAHFHELIEVDDE